jgi:hypothetical protein
MAKNLKDLTEPEIDKVFEIMGIKRRDALKRYEVIKKSKDYVELKTDYGHKMIIKSTGVSHSSPKNQEDVFCNNLERVENYLTNKGYNFKQKDN